MAADKGFLGSLFDLSFTEFVTRKVIKVLFILAVLFGGLMTLGMIIGGFAKGFLAGLGMLIISPVIFLLYVLFARIYLEILMVVFKIEDNTSRLVERKTPDHTD